MLELFYELFGYGKELSTHQVCVRTFLMFFIAIFLIRIGGIRIFGKKSSFDEVVAVMLGAILSRGVVGASPFVTVAASGLVLVLVHRVVAFVCIKNNLIATLLKGKAIVLYDNGKLIQHNLDRCSLSVTDLKESLRLEYGEENLECVEKAYMETSGRVSFIKKK